MRGRWRALRAGGGDAPLGGEEASHRTFGKIPAFEHAGFQLYEAGAITRYIDDAFQVFRCNPATGTAGRE